MNLSEIFENNSDCYADTREECNDTIPPIMIDGEVIQAMTKQTFIDTVNSILNVEDLKRDEKLFCPNCGKSKMRHSSICSGCFISYSAKGTRFL